MGKFNFEYTIHNEDTNDEAINLGIGMKSFWGELQESAFFAYVKDIRQVEDDLLTYFSVGLEYATDYKNAYFTSLGIFYHEDDWILHAEADYQ